MNLDKLAQIGIFIFMLVGILTSSNFTGLVTYDNQILLDEIITLNINQNISDQSYLLLSINNQEYTKPITELTNTLEISELIIDTSQFNIELEQGTYLLVTTIIDNDVIKAISTELIDLTESVVEEEIIEKPTPPPPEEDYIINQTELINITVEYNITQEYNTTNITELNLTETNITIENITEQFINLIVKEQVRINQPVIWIKTIRNLNQTNITTEIPKQATNITIKEIKNKTKTRIENNKIKIKSKQGEELPKTNLITGNVILETNITKEENISIVIEENVTEIEIEYTTPGPTSYEEEINKDKKRITINSDIHYTDIISYTFLNDTQKENINLYWIVDDSKIKVEFEAYDLNNNSLIDYIEWIIPSLSNQTYELEISIINLQSYPTVGGTWTVMFNTTGQADLIITASNSTTWSNENENEDLKFLELKCGANNLSYEWINNSVFISNYTCNQTGYETSKVITPGKHTLQFKFGDYIAYAYNDASNLIINNLKILSDVPANTSIGNLYGTWTYNDTSNLPSKDNSYWQWYINHVATDNTYTGANANSNLTLNSDALGIAYGNNSIWTTHYALDRFYKYNLSGTQQALYAIEVDQPIGIEYSNGTLWIVGDTTNKVYQFYENGSYAHFNFSANETGNQAVTDLTDAFGYFWILYGSNNKNVSKFYYNGSFALESFALNSDNANAGGITHINNYFLIPDISDKEVYIYYKNGSYYNKFSTGGCAARGITFEGGYFYIGQNTFCKFYGTYLNSSLLNNGDIVNLTVTPSNSVINGTTSNISYTLNITTMNISLTLIPNSTTTSSNVDVYGHINLSNGTNVANYGINIYINNSLLNVTNPSSTSITHTLEANFDGTLNNISVINQTGNITLWRDETGNYSNKSGTYISSVIDSEIWNSNWTYISWTEAVPYGEGLAHDRYDEINGGIQGGVNMSGNVLLLHFNNNSDYGENDSHAYDFSGSQNNGTIKSGSHYNFTNKKIGTGSLEFDGDDDHVQLGQSDGITKFTTMTISAWVYPTGAEALKTIIGRYDYTANKQSYLLYGHTSNYYNWLISGSGDSVTRGIVSGTSPTRENNWQHVVGTYDGTNMRIYIDGVLENTVAYNGGVFDSNLDVTIGRNLEDGGTTNHFLGTMDEVAIYNRSLSGEEISNMYKRGAARLNVSVRSCDDSACDTEGWSQQYENATLNILNQSTNRYFQYKANFYTENTNITPILEDITINYTTTLTDSSGDYNFTFIAPSTPATYEIKVNTTYQEVYGEQTANLEINPGETPPSLIITSPTNNGNYTDSIISLNYTVTATDSSVDSCWYNLNSAATNTTLASCANTTITINEETNTLYIYANDTYNKLNTTIITFIKDTLIPSIDYGTNTELNNTYLNQNYIYVNVTVNESREANITFILHNTTSQVNETVYTNQERTINWTVENLNEIYYYNVTVIDWNNSKNSTGTRVITLDNTTPSQINLTTPSNDSVSTNRTPFLNWTITTEINFRNYTIQLDDNSDFSSIDFTYYKINETTNTSYQVTSDLTDDTVFYWRVIAYDKAENSYTSEYYIYTIDNTEPNVNLELPSNNSWSASSTINFNFTVTDLTISNCSLYTNESGTWKINNTANATSGTTQNITTNNFNNGEYIWNIRCYDQANRNAYNNSNYTINVDTVYPSLTLSHPQELNYSYNSSISLNYTSIDNNLFQTWYHIGDNSNLTLTGNTTFNASEGLNTIYLYNNDSAGNVNFTSLIFRTDLTVPTITIDKPINNEYIGGTATPIQTTPSDSGSGINYVYYNITNSSTTIKSNTELTGDYDTTWDSSSTLDGNYTITAFVNDTTGYSTSTSVNIQIDNTNPTITTYKPSSDNTTAVNASITLNITCQDINVTIARINITNSTSGSEYLNLTNSSITLFRFTDIISTANWSEENKTIEIYCNDSINAKTEYYNFNIDQTAPNSSHSVSVTSVDANYQNITIVANASDLNLQAVFVNITLPNGTEVKQTLTSPDYTYYYYPPIAGTYDTNVYVNDSAGNYNFSSTVQFTANGSTTSTFSRDFSSVTITNMTTNENYIFTIQANLTNTGEATAYFSNISFSFENSFASTNYTNDVADCGNLSSDESCKPTFIVTVPAGTSGGQTLTITEYGRYTHPNKSVETSTLTSSVTINNNPKTELVENNISDSSTHGATTDLIGSFIINSTGNAASSTITYNTSGGNMEGWTINFDPANVAALASGATQTVQVYVTVPSGESPDYHWTNMSLFSDSSYRDFLILNVSIATDKTWSRTPAGFADATYSPSDSGTVGDINITNDGNVDLDFTIAKAVEDGENSLVSLSPSTVHVKNQSSNITTITYNTAGVASSTYQINITTTETSVPSSLVTTFNITVQDTPPQFHNLTVNSSIELNQEFAVITVNVTDDIGVPTVRLNITLPNNTVIERTMVKRILVTTYDGNYTPTIAGTHIATIYANDTAGNVNTTNITFEAVGSTGMNLIANTSSFTITDISQSQNKVININISLNNTGDSSAYNSMINLTYPSRWTISPTSNNLGNILKGTNTTQTFTITIPAGTWPTTETLTARLNYSEANTIEAFNTTDITITISSNPTITIESTINITADHDTLTSSEFMINSTGNDNLTNILLTCQSGIVCNNFTTVFNVSSFNLTAGYNRTIKVNITVPKTFPNNNYTGTLNISSDETSSTMILNVTVPLNDSWVVVPTTLSVSSGAGSTGDFETLNITNLGNIPINLSINSTNTTLFYVNVTSINININSTYYVLVNYTTPTGIQNHSANISITNSSLTQNQVNITASIEVINFRTDIITPSNITPNELVNTTLNVTITANATYLDNLIGDNVTFTAKFDTTSCTVLSTTFSTNWNIICQAPNLTQGEYYDLKLTGTFTNLSASYTDTETRAIYYPDINLPSIINSTVFNIEEGQNQTLELNITDNVNISSPIVQISYPNGTIGNHTLTLENNLYKLNLTNLSKGDYDLIYHINDSSNNIQTTTQYFEVYTGINISGTVLDAIGTGISTEFNFYRPNNSRKLYNFTTNSTGGYILNQSEIHDRLYDIKIEALDNSLFIEDVIINETTDNIIKLDEVQGSDISETVSLQEPLLGLGILSNLTFSSGNLTIDYSDTTRIIDSESTIIIYKCDNWDFTARTCNSTWTAHENYTLNTATNEINALEITSFSAYLATEPSCGDGTCSSGYGETTSTCSADCTSDSGSPGGSTGGGGSSSSSSSKLQELIEDLSNIIDGIKITTNSIEETVAVDQTKTINVQLRNTENTASSISLTLSGSISEIMEPDAQTINLNPLEEGVAVFTITPQPGDANKIFNGDIIIQGSESSMTLPVRIEVTESKQRPSNLLDIKLNPLQQTVEPGETLSTQINLYNMGKEKRVDIQLNLQLINPKTSEIIIELEEAIALETTLNLIKHIEIPKDIKFGTYIVKGEAYYFLDEKRVSANSFFYINVRKPILQIEILGIVLWKYLITIIIITSSTLGVIYIRRKIRETRKYKNIIKTKKLPSRGKNSIKVGKIAETMKPAYLDLNQLKMHTLIAGATGSGKSITAQDIVEEALDKKVSVIVFDPTAQWTGFLRKCKDEDMFKIYPKFRMRQSDARAFKGSIRIIRDPKEIIDIKQHTEEGQITIFSLNKLQSKDIDTVIASTIQQIFDANLEESKDLKLLLVYDEVHRLLPKFGGSGKGVLQIERACREFRKWGVGLVLISQILQDFIEDIHANIATEIQMKTKHISDLNRIKEKYGTEILQIINMAGTGAGMVENSEYNEGKPYFIEFRPIKHNTQRLSDEDLEKYDNYNQKIKEIEYQLQQLKELKQDMFDLETELKLSKDKLQLGNFNMVDIYLESLIPKLSAYWGKIGKQPKHIEKRVMRDDQLNKGLTEAKVQREKHMQLEIQLDQIAKSLIEKGYTKEQIKKELEKKKYPKDIIKNVIKKLKEKVEKQEPKVEKKDKKSQELEEYIKKVKEEGYTNEEIKEELKKVGWSEEVITNILK